jgi:phenylacetate-CoA ligase
LPDFLGRVKESAPAWSAHLESVDAGDVTSREALAHLPVMRKGDLKRLQLARPPLGGLSLNEDMLAGRVFMSPGPIFEPEGLAEDWWRSARALYAAGFRKGDLVHNTFAYHLTPGGWILDAGARALGCTVIPAGPGNTEQQLECIAHLKPNAYVGVPDYLKILLDKAEAAGRPIASFKRALVSGGALFPSLRQEYRERGIRTYQVYATADAGIIAYESQALEGMIIDEGVIVEIVRPGTGDLVPTFNRYYPMIRLATGDLSAIMEGQSACGRTNTRIKGWMGRADQTTKVKGMFVHPEQVATVAARHPEIFRLRLVVGRDGETDVMTLYAEAETSDPSLAEKIAQTVQDVTKLRGAVELVPPGSLPNDGKVIADERDYAT